VRREVTGESSSIDSLRASSWWLIFRKEFKIGDRMCRYRREMIIWRVEERDSIVGLSPRMEEILMQRIQVSL
jgi:hypothetical protein